MKSRTVRCPKRNVPESAYSIVHAFFQVANSNNSPRIFSFISFIFSGFLLQSATFRNKIVIRAHFYFL